MNELFDGDDGDVTLQVDSGDIRREFRKYFCCGGENARISDALTRKRYIEM